MRVLITGGSGYLGQHLLAYFHSQPANPHELFYTCATKPLDALEAPGTGLFMDLTNLSSVQEAVEAARPDVVLHTAAQSSPAASEKDAAGAHSTNAPSCLLDALDTLAVRPLLIYTSTDQVFSGDGGAPYSPDDDPKPINEYGLSKLAFEKLLQERWKSHYVVLRSSNIVGPPAPYTQAAKFLQWLEPRFAIENLNPVELFEDEIRSFISVFDVCQVMSQLLHHWEATNLATATTTLPQPPSRPLSFSSPSSSTASTTAGSCVAASSAAAVAVASSWAERGAIYHMGGPEPLSRIGLAEALCAARPKTCSLNLPDNSSSDSPPSTRIVPTRRASLSLGYESPLDIHMNSVSLEEVVGFRFKPMREVLRNGSTLEAASGAHASGSDAGGGNSGGAGDKSAAGADARVLAFSFSDAFCLAVVAWGVWHALRRAGFVSVQNA